MVGVIDGVSVDDDSEEVFEASVGGFASLSCVSFMVLLFLSLKPANVATDTACKIEIVNI